MGAAAAWALSRKWLSADEAVERFATRLGSERDAIHHLTTLVRHLQVPLFHQEFLDDGTDCISPYTPEESQAAWLGRYEDGCVRDLHDGGLILFRRTDLEGLSPPLVEPVEQPLGGKPPDPTPVRRRPTDAELCAAVAKIDKRHKEGAHPGEEALGDELRKELSAFTVLRDDVRDAFKGHRLWGSRGRRATPRLDKPRR